MKHNNEVTTMVGFRKPSFAENNEYLQVNRRKFYTGHVVVTRLLSMSRQIMLSTALMSALGILSVGANAAYAAAGDQIIVKDVAAAKGWTAVVPLNLNGDNLTDMLSYNAKTGRAIYSVAAQP